MSSLLLTLLATQTTAAMSDGMPAAVPLAGPGITGTVLRHAAMPSSHVAARNVDVWLPPGYAENPERRYPVVYMHDGQNLFDPATSMGNVDWAVDEAMTGLIARGAARPGDHRRRVEHEQATRGIHAATRGDARDAHERTRRQ